MARKVRNRKRKGGRSRRSKTSLGRILLIVGVVVALLYFTFTKVLYDPFEEPQPSFDQLAPRDVDIYVRRESLATDFSTGSTLPMPRVFDRLRRTREWADLEETAWWQALEWPDELEAVLTELEPQLAEIPFDPLLDVLGQEVVLIGRDVDSGGKWGLLARLSAKAKLAVELFASDTVLDEAIPGAVREDLHDEEVSEVLYHRITLPPVDGATEGDVWFYARETDMLVVSDDELLVRDVLRRVHGSASQDVVGLSRLYAEHMPPAPGEASQHFSAGFILRLGKLLESWELHADSAQSEDASANILAKLVDTRLVDDAAGRLEFAPGWLGLQLHGELDVGRASEDKGGLVGQPAFPVHERMTDMLGIMPKDISAIVTMNVSLRRFLTTAVSGFSPDVLTLVNSTLREMSTFTAGWQVDNLPELIDELSRALGNELTLVVRPLDHEIPEGSQPLPAMAAILPMANLEAWLAIEDAFLRGHQVYGVPSDRMKQVPEGVGDRKWLGLVGMPIEEVAYIVLDGETFAISTDNDLLRDIVQAYTGARTALAQESEVRQMLAHYTRGGTNQSLANAAGWMKSGSLLKVLRPYGPWLAEMDTILDFGVERARQRGLVVARDYPDYRGREDELPEALEQELNEKLDALLDEQERQRLEEVVPGLAAEWLDGWKWMPLLEQASFALRMGDRSADLEIRLDTVGG
jgi:hypothetical protein